MRRGGWDIDVPEDEEGFDRVFDELRDYMIVQGLIEQTRPEQSPLGEKTLFVVTQKGRRMWLALDSARMLEVGSA